MTSIHELFILIKNKIVVIIVMALLGATAGGLYTYFLVPPTYIATATMYVSNNNSSKQVINSTDIIASKSLVDTYSEILKSDTTLSRVVEDLPQYDLSEKQIRSMLDTESLNQTEIFQISISSESQLMSRDICQEIVKIGQDEIIRVIQAGTVTVVDGVKVPTEKHWNMGKNIGIGLAVFLFLTLLSIFIHDELDMTVRARNILEKFFNIPVIGIVPNLDYVKKRGSKKKHSKRSKSDGLTVGRDDSKYIISMSNNYTLQEAYRAVKANIFYMGNEKACKIYAITSAVPNECKTVSSINTALAIQRSGKKVILLDFDLRRPRIKYDLDIDYKYGITDYLRDDSDDLPIVSYKDTGLAVMCAGQMVSGNFQIIDNILDGKQIANLLEKLSSYFDYIIIDTPPLNIASDALAFAKFVDGYFLSVRADYSDINDIKLVVKKLESVNSKISGFILNGVNPNYLLYSGYYSGYTNNSKNRKYYQESSLIK